MRIRDRIMELRRIPASELMPNPRNWRTHPPEQAAALQGLFAEIGYTNALLARQLRDGSLELIDGHLRAETAPHAVVPVLVLDVSADEAEKILLSHDPLAAMAGVDRERLGELLGRVDTQSDAVAAMFTQLAVDAGRAEELLDETLANRGDIPIHECFQIVIECTDEDHQRILFERMTEEGYPCRLLTL